MTNKTILFITLCVIIGLISCSKKTIFEKYEKIENYTWDNKSVVSFDVPIHDIGKKYNIYIMVRHAEVYPFDNLYVGLDIYTPAGDKRSKDFYLEIRNEDRSFKGEVLGDIWDVKVKVMKNVTFTKAGIHKFDINNLMPYINIPDVMEIGLLVETQD